MPEIVDDASFRATLADLTREEKAVTRQLEVLGAKRRNLPATKVEDPETFLFTASNGKQVSLIDLFEGRQQLIIYHVMLEDTDKDGCVGCSFIMDHIPHLGHLNSRNTTFAALAPASIEKINAYRERMGWQFPFYSCGDTFTAADQAGQDIIWKPGFTRFGIVVFARDGDDVLLTYGTARRGSEILLSTYALLDMTPLGRQEVGNGIVDFKLHDKY